MLASRPSPRRFFVAASCVAALYVLVSLGISVRFGPTIDCASGDYAYGEATLQAVLDGEDSVQVYAEGPAASSRQPHPTFAGKFRWSQLFPLASTASAASCWLFWSRLGWLAPFPAHHLVNTVLMAGLLASVVVFLGRRAGLRAGLFAAAFLVAAPRFFTHAQNNLKDLPEACLYAFAVFAFARAMSRPGVRRWVVVGVLVALAMAQKQNALFLPLQFAVTALVFRGMLPGPRVWRGRDLGASLLAFVFTYALVSPWLWHDVTRLGTHLGDMLEVSGIGARTVTWDGPLQVLITTPLPLLLFAIVGAFSSRLERRPKILLVTWLVFVLARLLIPGIRNFNGVRHFLEFYPPLAMLAACGLESVLVWLGSRAPLETAVVLVVLAPGALATWRTFPYGTVYFNALVGGLDGAVEAHVRDAGDYWCSSYWEGLAWLEGEAEPGSELLVSFGSKVAHAGAGAMRSPPKFLDPAQPGPGPLFVMHTLRSGAFQAVARAVDSRKPALEIVVQGAPILRIQRIDDPGEIRQIASLAKSEGHALVASQRILAWAASQEPARTEELLAIVGRLRLDGRDVTLERFDALLPESLHSAARVALGAWEGPENKRAVAPR
jgi:hypothetical protein